MSERNNPDPLHDPIIMIVIFIVIGAALSKCSIEVDIRETVTTAATGIVTMIARGLGYYLLPFVVGSVVVMMGLIFLCQFGKSSAIHAMDFSHLGIGIPVLAAIAIFLLGIPNSKAPWTYSLWAAILFGGPALMWAWGRPEHQKEDEEFEQSLVVPLSEQISELESRVNSLQWSRKELTEQLEVAKKEVAELKENHKAKDEKIAQEAKRKGVLDSEEF